MFRFSFFFSSFFGDAISHWILFFFLLTVKLVQDWTYSGNKGSLATLFFCYRETLESQITRKVLLHQMWGVKSLAHLPFPIYNTLVISQQVHNDSAPKLYLVYLAGQLHIQASHLLTVEMFLNWGLFIPGTATESPLYTYINKYIYIRFSLIWFTVTLFLSAVSEKCFFPLTTPPKCCSNAWRRNDLHCSYLWVSELIF